MNIAFLNPYGGGLYGATQSLRRLLVHWPATDQKVLFTVPNPLLEAALGKCISHISHFRLPHFTVPSSFVFFAGAFSVARKLGRSRTEMMVWNGGYLGIAFPWLVSLWSGIPFVAIMRDLVIARSAQRARRYLSSAAGIISVSRAIQSAMHQAVGELLTVPQRVLYDPLPDLPTEPPGDRRLPSAPIIGMFGYLCHLKGQDLLVEAAPQVAGRYPNARFRIVGNLKDPTNAEDAQYVDRLKQRIATLGLTVNFEFLGYREDVPSLMQECSAVVIASRRESFGMVAVEAWSQGVPTVAMDLMGPAETHHASGAGLLFPREDFHELGNALLQLLGSEALNHELGRKGVAWARRNCDPRVYALEFRAFVAQCRPTPGVP